MTEGSLEKTPITAESLRNIRSVELLLDLLSMVSDANNESEEAVVFRDHRVGSIPKGSGFGRNEEELAQAFKTGNLTFPDFLNQVMSLPVWRGEGRRARELLEGVLVKIKSGEELSEEERVISLLPDPNAKDEIKWE